MNAERRPVGFGRRLEDATRPPTRPHVPDGAVGLDDAAMQLLIPKRDGRGHKGTFGKVLVVAGSLDYAGAGLLVCRAAGRGGAGLVTLAVPESLQPLFAAKVVEATTMALPEDDLEEVDPEPALAKILDHEHDALVLGPGLRPSLATAELVRLVLTTPEEPAAAPAVLDAEALRILATADEWWSAVTRPAILTPHPGEFARLRSGAGHESDEDGDIAADDDARVRAAKSAAVEWRQVVVLKGARTVVAAPDGAVAVAPFENPALATGGTGDVLAGTIGALLAQGLEPFGAAQLGVYLHGLAGEAVRERLGEAGLLASDLPDQIPLARKRLAALAERGRREKRIGFGVREADVAATGNPAGGGVDDDDAEGRQQRPGANPQPAPAGDGDAGR